MMAVIFESRRFLVDRKNEVLSIAEPIPLLSMPALKPLEILSISSEKTCCLDVSSNLQILPLQLYDSSCIGITHSAELDGFRCICVVYVRLLAS